MIEMRDANGTTLNPTDPKGEMDTHGYALIRGLLSPKDLNRLLRDITKVLHQSGWLNSDRDLQNQTQLEYLPFVPEM